MHLILSFHYVLTGKDGKEIDSSREQEPLTIMTGSKQIIPGLENEIAGMKAGEKKKVFVTADKAYGQVNPALEVKVDRSKLPEGDIQVGTRFKGGPEPDSPIFTVVKIEGQEISLNGNHPLAGHDLNFEIEMVATREATEEEIKHGHVHGPGGHQH